MDQLKYTKYNQKEKKEKQQPSQNKQRPNTIECSLTRTNFRIGSSNPKDVQIMTLFHFKMTCLLTASTWGWGIHPTVPSNMVKCVMVPNCQLVLFIKNTINVHYFLRTAHIHNLAYAFNEALKRRKKRLSLTGE